MPDLISVSQPDFGQLESTAVQSVLTSQWVGMGPRTEAFEEALRRRLEARHVVATSSCTAALHLTLAALERDDRNEIIVPSLTFAATIQAILMAGYTPVFAEVDPDTLTLDCEDAARLLNKKTRAILPVHFAGYPCESKTLHLLAAQAGINIVSDSAHAFGTTLQGEPLTLHETATCFSFSANKNISCGEGGAVATQSDVLAARLKELRFLGISHHTWERRANEKPWAYTVGGSGFRYHMSDINAAIGLAQLERVKDFARKRREISAAYDAQLAGLPGMVPVKRDLEHTIPHLYIMRVTHGLRDALYESLRSQGIGCGVHYIPNHRQPAFMKFTRALPITEELAGQVISLPLHTQLDASQIERIVTAVIGFLRRAHTASPRQQTQILQEVAQ